MTAGETVPRSSTPPPVRLQISPTAAQVRTARLIAAAVARRSGVADGQLDEIRLAVGEACSRAVRLHREYAPTELVTVLLDGAEDFSVRVRDAVPAGSEPDGGDSLDGIAAFDGDGAVPAAFSLAVIGGLVDDLEIGPTPAGSGTEVRMRWPLAARSGPPTT